MKRLLTLTLILLISFTFSCKKNKDKTDDNQTQVADTAYFPEYEELFSEEDSTAKDSVETSNTSTQQIQTGKQDKKDIMVEDTTGKVKPATPEQIKHSKKFYVIVGSYIKLSNAQKRVKKFKNEGYAAEILPKYGNFNRVSAASFNNEISARKELKQLKNKYKDNTFWLLIRN